MYSFSIIYKKIYPTKQMFQDTTKTVSKLISNIYFPISQIKISFILTYPVFMRLNFGDYFILGPNGELSPLLRAYSHKLHPHKLSYLNLPHV
jgi:hypothetical protein